MRPERIEVQLLRNDEIYDTVTLDADNGWSHDWKELDARQTWKVTEKEVPSGYTTATALEGTTYLMTNTKKPDKSRAVGESAPPAHADNARLPQTGVLWWPVPQLAMSGLLLFTLGWSLLQRGKHDE